MLSYKCNTWHGVFRYEFIFAWFKTGITLVLQFTVSVPFLERTFPTHGFSFSRNLNIYWHSYFFLPTIHLIQDEWQMMAAEARVRATLLAFFTCIVACWWFIFTARNLFSRFYAYVLNYMLVYARIHARTLNSAVETIKLHRHDFSA